ncbi:MAG: hypothetical protein AAGJ34_08000 [Pseudomonadota bacterium]
MSSSVRHEYSFKSKQVTTTGTIDLGRNLELTIGSLTWSEIELSFDFLPSVLDLKLEPKIDLEITKGVIAGVSYYEDGAFGARLGLGTDQVNAYVEVVGGYQFSGHGYMEFEEIQANQLGITLEQYLDPRGYGNNWGYGTTPGEIRGEKIAAAELEALNNYGDGGFAGHAQPSHHSDLPHPDYAKSSSGYDPHEVGSAHWDAYGPGGGYGYVDDVINTNNSVPGGWEEVGRNPLDLTQPTSVPTVSVSNPPLETSIPTTRPDSFNTPLTAAEKREARNQRNEELARDLGFDSYKEYEKFQERYGEFGNPPGYHKVPTHKWGSGWKTVDSDGNDPGPSPEPEGGWGGANGDPNVSGGSDSQPILLDLNGNGVEITKLSESTVFMAGKDGLDHNIAWAAAGDGVLFYDPDGTGEITELRQFVFTEWDPTASSDIEALANVFDSNGDGVFDANDAEWANFKVMVTNARSTQIAQRDEAVSVSEAQTIKLRGPVCLSL